MKLLLWKILEAFARGEEALIEAIRGQFTFKKLFQFLVKVCKVFGNESVLHTQISLFCVSLSLFGSSICLRVVFIDFTLLSRRLVSIVPC